MREDQGISRRPERGLGVALRFQSAAIGVAEKGEENMGDGEVLSHEVEGKLVAPW